MTRQWVLIICFLFGVLTSCTKGISTDTSLNEEGEVLFSDPGFSLSSLKASGITILPMASIRASEGIRQNAIYEVQQALSIYLPHLNLIKQSETLSQAKSLGLKKGVQTGVDHYERSGHLDSQFLNQLHVMTETRYFLYLRVNDFNFFIKKGMVGKKVELEAEIWDAQCTKVVWSGIGRVAVVERAQNEQARYEEMFVSAARNLVVPLTEEKRKKEGQEKCVS